MRTSVLLLGLLCAAPVLAQKSITCSGAHDYGAVRELSETNNSTAADAYPWLSPDGLRLYYTSGATKEIVFTHRNRLQDNFEPTVSAGIPVKDPTSCWFSENELHAYVSNGHVLYYTERSSRTEKFSEPGEISLSGIENINFISGASLDAEEKDLFIYADVKGENTILEFSRASGNQFTYVRTVEHPEGTAIAPAQLSKDALTLYIGLSHFGGREKMFEMTRAAVGDAFEESSLRALENLSDPDRDFGQPSMSDCMEWVVIMGSKGHTWENDDLFIAHTNTAPTVSETTAPSTATATTGTTPSSVITLPADGQLSNLVYPNPASDYAKVKVMRSSPDPVTLYLFSSVGTLILQQTIESSSGDEFTINTAELANGIYFIRCAQTRLGQPAYSSSKLVVQH